MSSVIQSRPRRMAVMHAGHRRQLEAGQGPPGHVRSLPHEDPVRHLLGVREVRHELTGDAEAMGHDPGDVDRVVGDALHGADDLQHRGHRLGLLLVAGRQHAHRPHVLDELEHLLVELVHLLGHVRITEVQRRVGQVDHQLRHVLGVGEHRTQAAASSVHG